ncbi:unnamed protein product [Closterium sp. NIES-65]|nr:unnamed protein product [Closterium sp. NIES-65]
MRQTRLSWSGPHLPPPKRSRKVSTVDDKVAPAVDNPAERKDVPASEKKLVEKWNPGWKQTFKWLVLEYDDEQQMYGMKCKICKAHAKNSKSPFGPLGIGARDFQVDIGEVKLLVDKLKLKLAQRYVENRADYGTSKSKHLHAFLEKHGSPDKREITIRGLDKQGTACTIKDILHENPIGKDKKTDLDSCIKLGQEFAQELIAKLDSRLGDLKHFDGAKQFMPMHYPPRPADREGWLNVHLYELLDMFKEKLPGVTYQECQLEMELFAATMFKKFKDLTFQQALTNVLRTSDWRDDYPTLVHLWRALAVLPLSTVECERGFSRQNIIK